MIKIVPLLGVTQTKQVEENKHRALRAVDLNFEKNRCFIGLMVNRDGNSISI